MTDLVQQLLEGNRRALARLLTWVENDREGAAEALAALFPHTGRAWVIGVTGSPGTGKSSLVTALARALRVAGHTVAILAVDPTSPFTGGAILGDRIRMVDLAGDAGVFIRSMATRGSLGGLARASRDAVRVLDAAGFDYVLVETVGAGQSEVDIVRLASTTIVVEVPGLGDEVQAIKAGILEIADVLVVNKADRPGALNTVRALRAMLEMGHDRRARSLHHGFAPAPAPPPTDPPAAGWPPPVIPTLAPERAGIEELVTAIEAHRQHLLASGDLAAVQREAVELELYERLREALLRDVLRSVPTDVFTGVVAQVQARELAPQEAVRRILAAMPALSR